MMAEKRKNDQKSNTEAIIPAIILIGLGLIFWLDLNVWPWILAVVGLVVFFGGVAKGERLPEALEGAVWLWGIFILALTDFWWPGILFLVGFSLLFEALIKPRLLAPEIEKRKRGLPLPPRDEDDSRYF